LTWRQGYEIGPEIGQELGKSLVKNNSGKGVEGVKRSLEYLTNQPMSTVLRASSSPSPLMVELALLKDEKKRHGEEFLLLTSASATLPSGTLEYFAEKCKESNRTQAPGLGFHRKEVKNFWAKSFGLFLLLFPGTGADSSIPQSSSPSASIHWSFHSR
jgi:hypothetical protein